MQVSFDQPLTFHFVHQIRQYPVSSDMKKFFSLPMFISFAMICSCQKQDSAAEQQLAQRKVELDAREDALNERLNALDEKVNALDQKVKELSAKERVTLNSGATATAVEGQTPDPAQVTAERERIVQQFRALVPNPSKGAAGDPAKQKQPGARQLGPEDLQRQWRQSLDKAKMSGKAVFPTADSGSPTPSPAVEETSPSPSATPE